MAEKAHFERLLGMSGGYVLDFTNNTFAEFFRENAGTDIYSAKYAFNGDSKAKRLRAFWEVESDSVVGRVLDELVAYWRAVSSQPDNRATALADACTRVVDRLLGRQPTRANAEDRFLGMNFEGTSLAVACADASLVPILTARWSEAERCFKSGASLATIVLCGSILEGLLLGAACASPQKFNQAPNSPRDRAGNVKRFADWRLAELIDVACDLGLLKLDVKKFSHVLRDFRNYIHPYQQMSSGFNPDSHTARICLQVLRAAIASLGGARGGA